MRRATVRAMLGRAVLDLLLPPRCPGCGVTTTSVWCGRCLVELNQLALPAGRAEELDDGVRAVGAYAYAGAVRDSLVAVKVRGHREHLDGMRALLWSRLALADVAGRTTVTWVPTAPAALRSRGVCVPRALAGPAAVPLLRVARRGVDQTSLPARARRRSKGGAFAPVSAVPPAVIVVDDVRTTGATARAAAAALRSAGATRVLVVTFAVGGDAARAAALEAAREAAGTAAGASAREVGPISPGP